LFHTLEGFAGELMFGKPFDACHTGALVAQQYLAENALDERDTGALVHQILKVSCRERCNTLRNDFARDYAARAQQVLDSCLGVI
jgi:hypothetical protein